MDEIKKLKEHFELGKILDVGTAEGTFMTTLYNAGASKVVGIEPAEERAIIGQNKGLDIRTCKFESFNSNETFDLVCFRESIYYIDLEELFNQLDKMLRPGGGLYIRSQSANSVYYWRKRGLAFRLNGYSPHKFRPMLKSLKTKFWQKGYGIEEASYLPSNILRCLDVPFASSWIGNVIGYRLSLIACRLGIADRFYIIAEKL